MFIMTEMCGVGCNFWDSYIIDSRLGCVRSVPRRGNYFIQDIFEAIRYLRQEKGTTAINIYTYIQERMSKEMKIRGFLKISEALSRLVDEGLLLKKGDKYVLPWPCTPSDNDKNDENGKGEGDGMEEDEDEDDDEDEDEDEDDDEDEEDDDDEDDDCPDEEDENKNGKTNGKGNGNGKANQESKPNRGGNDGGSNVNGNGGQMDEDLHSTRYKDSDWNQKHNRMLKKNMRSEFSPKFLFNRVKKQKPKQKWSNNMCDVFDQDDFRSSSPTRRDSSMIMDQGLPESEDEAHMKNCNFSLSYELEDFETYRYRSPNGSPPPNTPGVHEQRKESCCSDISTKIDDSKKTEPEVKSEVKAIKKEPSTSRQSLDRSKEKQVKKREREGGEEKTKVDKVTKRDVSLDVTKEVKQGSCAYCKKKIFPKYETCCE